MTEPWNWVPGQKRVYDPDGSFNYGYEEYECARDECHWVLRLRYWNPGGTRYPWDVVIHNMDAWFSPKLLEEWENHQEDACRAYLADVMARTDAYLAVELL